MFGKFFREYIFKLVVALAVTSTIAIFAVINKYWTWPTAIVGAVLLLCGILYLMERLGIGPSIKSRVRDWLDNSGYAVQTIHAVGEFHFVMTDNIGLRTSIMQAKAGDSVSIFSVGHKATPQQLAAFNSLGREQQEAFWKNVRLELLRYGISFSDLKLDGEGVAFSENVVVTAQTSGTEFLRQVLFVRSGSRLYWELLSALNDPTQSSSAGTAPTQPTIPPASKPDPQSPLLLQE